MYYHIYVVSMRFNEILLKYLRIKKRIFLWKLLITLVIIKFPKHIKFLDMVAVMTIVVTVLKVIRDISEGYKGTDCNFVL